MAAVLVCAALATIAETLIPLLLRRVVDDLIADRPGLGLMLTLIMVVGLAGFLFGVLRRWWASNLALKIDYELRTAICSALLSFDGKQHDRLRRGQVISRAVSDIIPVTSFILSVPLLFTIVLTSLVSLGVMMVLSPLLSLVMLMAMVVLYLIVHRSNKVMFEASLRRSKAAGAVADVVESTIDSVRVVKGFGQEQQEQERLEQATAHLYAAGRDRARVESRVSPLMAVVPALAQIGILLIGGWLALDGRISLGTFLAFAGYLTLLVVSVSVAVNQLAAIQNARVGLTRIFELLDLRPNASEPDGGPGGSPLSEAPAALAFASVGFGYDQDVPVLREVSFAVEPGEIVAVIGAAGSGKSSLAMLAGGHYTPQSGAVRIGGRAISDLSANALSSHVSIAFEDSFLFSASIAENIALGRPGATREDIVSAAEAAEAHEFILGLDQGYATMVGEGGNALSGGQRQRIALARAVLADTPVLILDDATSAVDVETEQRIHDNLRRILRERTTIVIARRESTLRLADRIVVLQDGRVVGLAGHEELMASCEHYRTLLTGSGTGPAETAEEGTFTPELWPQPSAPEPVAAADHGLPGTLEGARRQVRSFSVGNLCRTFAVPLAACFVLAALDTAGQLAMPWLTRQGIDSGVSADSWNTLLSISGIAFAVVLVHALVRMARVLRVGRTGEAMLSYLRIKCGAQLNRLGLGFYERSKSGRIMTTMTADIDDVAGFLRDGLTQALISLLSLAGVLVMLTMIDPSLALAVLASFALIVLVILTYRRLVADVYAASRQRLAAMNTSLHETMAGVRVIQAYGNVEARIADFRGLAASYVESERRAQLFFSIFFSFVFFVSAPVTVLVLALAAPRLASGQLTVGDLFAVMLYIAMLFGPLQMLSGIVDGYQRAKVGLRRVSTLLTTEVDTPQPAEPVTVDRLAGAIEFRNVSFSYPDTEERALSDISLRIAPGERVAFVGETGAGKSTLVKMVARFYDPTTGRVSVDGTDLREFDLAGYRSRLGYVPQESTLFTGTVRETISYGRPDAPPEQVEATARQIGVHATIASWRHGYHHELGERGNELSAGQRQLLSIARAHLVEPDILVLDEATASLDLVSEAIVARAINLVARDRTTLVIAHRLSTARTADRIVVLHRGRVAEVGTHRELLDLGGRYRHMWEAFTRPLTGKAETA